MDIDVLVRHEHLSKAVKALAKKGFRIEVLEPYTVTMSKGGTIVDLYTHPSFAWIVYLDGERLLGEAEIIEVNGLEAKPLTNEAEAVVTAAHAVYKEHIYLLTDYYVTRQWLNSKVMRLAEELRAEEAAQISLELNRQIEQNSTETPVKLNSAQTAKILAAKLLKDPNFRETSINTIKVAAKKRTIQQITYRIKRKTY